MNAEDNLQKQRELAQQFVTGDPASPEEWLARGQKLAGLVQDLDSYLSHGGTLPLDWGKGRSSVVLGDALYDGQKKT